MGVELFGAQYLEYFAIACFLSYLFSGHSSIYLSQQIAAPKGGMALSQGVDTLKSARDVRRFWWRRQPPTH